MAAGAACRTHSFNILLGIFFGVPGINERSRDLLFFSGLCKIHFPASYYHTPKITNYEMEGIHSACGTIGLALHCL